MAAAATMRVAPVLVLALALSLACEPDPTTHAGISPVVEHLLPLMELTIFYHLLYEAVDFRGQCHLAGVFPCSRQEAAEIRGLNFQVTSRLQEPKMPKQQELGMYSRFTLNPKP